jgi:hypothetical protein
MPASVEEISGVSRYHIPWRGTLTLEEECGLVGDEVTGEVLRGVHQTSDGCAPKICALEQVKQGRSAAQLSLDLDGALNHGELLSVVL